MGNFLITRRLEGSFSDISLTKLSADQYPRSGRLVFSDEGQNLMGKVWREILEILGPVVPEIERVAYGDL